MIMRTEMSLIQLLTVIITCARLSRVTCVPVAGNQPSAQEHVHCNNPLGVRSSAIFDQPLPSQHTGAYIQAEFPRVLLVSGIVSQGSDSSSSRITHFKVSHSTDCENFHTIRNNGGQPMVFVANLEADTATTTIFDDVFQAKCVRILPTQQVGQETAMRLEFLGCDQQICNSELLPQEVIENNPFKRFVFGTEKIVTSLRIDVVPTAMEGVPAFIVAHSRTCNFNQFDSQIIKENGMPKLFAPEPGTSEIIINTAPFPVRAQCFAMFTPDPRSLPLHVHTSDGRRPSQILGIEQYQVTFQGCDAVEPHDTLNRCGTTRVARSRRQKRVVGGLPSLPGEWPWLVSLHFLKNHTFTEGTGLRHLCGATLIHPQWIVTAAHCLHELAGTGLSNKSNWLVVLGEHNQLQHDGTEQALTVEKIVPHPDFVLEHGREIIDDLAMIKLSTPVVLSDYVNTICIEPNYTFPDGTTCITAGWGNIDYEGHGVELPNHAMIKLVPQRLCERRYAELPSDHQTRSYVSIVESVLCAIGDSNGPDSCQGDSGGPLMCYHGNHWTLVGIVSIGFECGDIRFPGIYTRVNHFASWMNQVIENN